MFDHTRYIDKNGNIDENAVDKRIEELTEEILEDRIRQVLEDDLEREIEKRIRVLLAREERQAQSRLGHTGPKAAVRLAERFLDGPDTEFYDNFRLQKPVFKALVRWLARHTALESSQRLPLNLKVMILLNWLAFRHTQRQLGRRFHLSQPKIGYILAEGRKALSILHESFLAVPESDFISEEPLLAGEIHHIIERIGAVGGTHQKTPITE